jgi:RNA polymerase sigma factor (TIGR02999 family)
MPDVTGILQALDRGDPQAAAQLLPLVYHELRRLAARKLAREAPGQTLDATALVHEAYLRLVQPAKPQAADWAGRGHFFAAAAEAMRRILVEAARRKKRARHGGGRRRVEWDEALALAVPPADDLPALDEALTRLEQIDPPAAGLVKLRYFAGLTMPQAAAAQGVPLRTAERNWAYARAWLHRALSPADPPGPGPRP